MDNAELELINHCLTYLGKDLLSEISEFGKPQWFNPEEFIVKEGQIVRHLPIVLSGTAKVYLNEADMQLLLYYIYPGATCIFSFAHLFGEKPVDFSAVAEEKSLLLLLPMHKVREWLLQYRVLSDMILTEYQKHYGDLLETTRQLICNNLESRVLSYLNTKANITGDMLLAISHQNIANDMATSREVISRVLKKMEREGKIIQQGRKIKLLPSLGL
ncbi:Crp/Fnr family transcriptional regulator [Mucilaginibacter sp. CAU 1740]|uniref:Crp/Fnr family transcriptional regulator n=1 Tax=Mucilaginibacter sp. CAU 1740 TaxID=3140365 RepID=UPI00325B0D51